MAAGGYKEFQAGETLDEDDINDFLMQGMLVFAGTAARGSAITSPVEGQFAFLTDSDTVTFHDGSDWVELAAESPSLQYLLVAGGGGGGGSFGGGGGAGGYVVGVLGETSGGQSTAVPNMIFATGQNFLVSVGAGGAGGVGGTGRGAKGGISQMSPVQVDGGGGGNASGIGFSAAVMDGGSGGGSSEAGTSGLAGSGTVRQGFNGQTSVSGGGGGGGAGEAGGTDGTGEGGDGLSSAITGSSVPRGGGGGGGGNRTGGDGGGGNGSTSSPQSGDVNTGGGGGGFGGASGTAGNGGSGIVIMKYPATFTLTIGVGLTSATVTSGDFKITSFTDGSDVVTVG